MGISDEIIGAGVALGLVYGGVKLVQSLSKKKKRSNRRQEITSGSLNTKGSPFDNGGKIKMYIDR